MIMRRAKAYSSSCSQTVSLSPAISSSMLIRLESSSLVPAVIGSMPMPICNCFHESLANNGKITTFTGYHSLMPSCAGFLEPRKSRLGLWKSTFNAENFVCSFSMSISIGLTQMISAQFALEMCVAARNRQKIHRNPL